MSVKPGQAQIISRCGERAVTGLNEALAKGAVGEHEHVGQRRWRHVGQGPHTMTGESSIWLNMPATWGSEASVWMKWMSWRA